MIRCPHCEGNQFGVEQSVAHLGGSMSRPGIPVAVYYCRKCSAPVTCIPLSLDTSGGVLEQWSDSLRRLIDVIESLDQRLSALERRLG